MQYENSSSSSLAGILRETSANLCVADFRNEVDPNEDTIVEGPYLGRMGEYIESGATRTDLLGTIVAHRGVGVVAVGVSVGVSLRIGERYVCIVA